MQNFKRSVGALLSTLALTSTALEAAQVLTPIRVGGSNSGADLSTVAAPLNAGSTLFFDINYSVTGSQTKDEAGIGLKIQYDSSKFDPVITYDGLGAVTSTLVSNLLTKCMIASPSDQLVSGTTREVVFGWIDTSIRTTPAPGAVGWPGTSDPAAAGAANGCLNPGSIVTTTSAFVPPTALFRIGLKSKSTFNGGAGQVTSNIVLTTAGNISYAATGNVDTNKTIVVNAAPAALCTLDVNDNGDTDPFTDGFVLLRYLLGVGNAALLTNVTVPGPINTAAGIRARLDGRPYNLQGSPSADPFVDGFIALRLMLGVGNAALLNGIVLPATGLQTAAAIRTNANTLCGTSF